MAKFTNKESLADLLVSQYNLKKRTALEVVNTMFDAMADTLEEDGTVDISGFGKFILFHRKERMGINPVTKERMEIPSSLLPKFKPSQTLKNRCNPERPDAVEV